MKDKHGYQFIAEELLALSLCDWIHFVDWEIFTGKSFLSVAFVEKIKHTKTFYNQQLVYTCV